MNVELSFCTLSIEHSIIVLRYKPKRVNLEDCYQFLDWCNKNIAGQKYLMLNVLHPNNSFTEEAKQFSAKEGTQFSIAEAFVLNNGFLKIIGNFYLRFNKPNAPTRLFSSEDDARAWLLSQLRLSKDVA